jgi:hypothetical protein
VTAMNTPTSSNQLLVTGELEKAVQRITAEILDGIAHGHFELSVTCEVIGGGRRRLVLRAGKSYVFLLPEKR